MVLAAAIESLKRAVATVLIAALPIMAGAQLAEPDPLAEASAIQQRIDVERREGSAEAAWNLERDLVSLALESPDNSRSAGILSEVGDHRVDMLARFNGGEYVPEIALGCYYYNYGQFDEALRRGSQTVTSAAVSNAGNFTCESGSHSRAARALAAEALSLYVEAARMLARNGEAVGDELASIVMKLLPVSYSILNHATGRSSLELLLAHQEANAASVLAQAQSLAYIGDWELSFVPYLGTKYSESAASAYGEALALLAAHGIAEGIVDSIFSPQTPLLLPAFGSNRLESPELPGSTGHVDVAFEIRDDGRSARVKILDTSENASRSDQRDVANRIKRGRFRPIAANGELLESAPVMLRYYLYD